MYDDKEPNREFGHGKQSGWLIAFSIPHHQSIKTSFKQKTLDILSVIAAIVSPCKTIALL